MPTDGNRLVRAIPALKMAHRMRDRDLVIEIDGTEPAVYARLKGCQKRECVAGPDRLRLIMRRLYGREDAAQMVMDFNEKHCDGEESS